MKHWLAHLSFGVIFSLVGISCNTSPSGLERASSVAQKLTGTVTSVTAGWGHSCELLSDGTVQCWGDNGYGELGLGTYGGTHNVPAPVAGVSGATAIAGSYAAECALMPDQTVSCWGYGYGPTPVTISGLTGAVAVSVSGESWSHGCAVLNDTTVSCWGDNSWGQLGNGTQDASPGSGAGSTTAVPVLNLTGAVAVQAGAYGTCALLSNGTVQCWGDNIFGELGIGTTTGPGTCYAPFNWACSTVPVQVSGLSGAIAIASGDGWHTCALLLNGTVSCWGYNSDGQLGDGTTTSRSTPVSVSGLSGVTAIAAGELHSCALVSGGGVQCWGANGSGQLGNGTTANAWGSPVAVVGLSGTTSIAAGGSHSCALLSGGSVTCWGQNTYGQLGDGTQVSSPIPQGSSPGLNPVGVSAGWGHSCELMPDGTVQCWGDNGYGELGLGTYGGTHNVPAPVPGVSGVAAIAGSYAAECALMPDQTVSCWGYGYGSTPVTISGLTGAVAVSVSGESWSHGCAVLSDTSVSCWGDNSWGQLGNGTQDASPGSGANSTTAVPVSNLRGAVAVQASAYGTCALLSNGTVQCWGDNIFGELGIGTTTGPSTCYAPFNWACSTVPVQVSGLSGAIAIASGDGWHTCALLLNGTVSCWGYNSNGQLGDGTTTSRSAPVSVSGLSGVTAIGAGELHSCAVLSSGGVQCWGANGSGQLGNGTTTDSPAPVPASGVSDALTISGGGAHSCALLSGSAGIKCWGNNTYGQLGTGAMTSSSTAVSVSGSTHPGSQQLTGYVTPAMAAAPLVGPVPPATMIHLTVGLPAHDPRNDPSPMPLLQDFVDQISDPASPTFRQQLTPTQFAQTYGPAAADYNALVSYLTSNGLTVDSTYANGLLVGVTGPASAVQQAFFVNLNYYLRPDGTQFFALDREPSLNLGTSVLRISGLDNAFVATSSNPGSEPNSNGFSAADLRNAYVPCASNLTAESQTVGLISFGGFDPNDIAGYQAASGIPSNPALVTPVYDSNLINQLSLPHFPQSSDGNPETTLDIEMVNAMAPAAQVAVYEGPSKHIVGNAAVINQMLQEVGDNFHISQISSSYDFDEDENTAQAMLRLAAQGQSFFFSAGDQGAYPGGAQIDAFSPALTVVGGTVLNMTGPGGAVCNPGASCAYSSESAWPFGGGGILNLNTPNSLGFPNSLSAFSTPLPTYQQGLANSANEGSTTNRMVPDVSAVAQNAAILFNSQWQQIGGTSVASPVWAGYMALANQRIEDIGLHGFVGFANPTLYAVAASAAQARGFGFNDVTTGFNDNNSGTHIYPATSGYDMATGLGSPTCPLLDQLASNNPTVPVCAPGVSLCGLACCPSGICNNFVCQTPPAFQITVGVKALEDFGADVCVSGTGFTPNGKASVQIAGTPGSNGATVAETTVDVDATGRLSAFFSEVANTVICSTAPAKVTVTATDTTTFQAATQQVAGCAWCGTGSQFICNGVGTCQ